MRTTRRQFLQQSGCILGTAALASAFDGLGRLHAATGLATDYRALVCIFLAGGNDGNNTVIPYDDYASYAAVRGTSAALNIPQASLLQIGVPSHQSLRFGFHPSMPEIQALYNSGQVGVTCNVGPLVRPITKVEYQGGAPRPENLFSHSDQQAQWQTSMTSGQSSLTGWGGRTADNAGPLNGSNTFPMIVSMSGLTIFSTGVYARPIVPGSNLKGFDTSATSTARYNAMRQLLGLDTNLALVKAKSDLTGAAIDNTRTLNTALSTAVPLQTVFPSSTLGGQLRQVAQIIAARSAIGLQRQIFFCSIGGFDTHSNQTGTQASLLTQVSQAMGAFYNATVELGVAPSVTSFTLSDFGRTFQAAAGVGSDHAWGNHHIIMGGSVRGGDFYGRYPTLALKGPDDVSAEGRWIPTTSVDQFGATLARWYGVDNASIPTVFPNIGSFASNDLGFML